MKKTSKNLSLGEIKYMAWTEQCKIAFKSNADWFLRKKNVKTKKGIMAILAQLSEESGIPQKTLWHWWNEEEKKKQENLKNQINRESGITIENNKENNILNGECGEIDQQPLPPQVCNRCNKNNVNIDSNTKKPYSEKSKYYGLCKSCLNKQSLISQLDKGSDEDDGILTFCPNCNCKFYINKKRINKGE